MIVRRCISCSPLLSFFYNSSDVPKGETNTEKLAVDKENEHQTGWDRLKRAMQPNEFGDLSPEANSILQAGCFSLFVGGMYGGFMNSREAYLEFFRTNQATVFTDHIHAKKKLQDHVTLAFGRGAYRFGWRLTFFTLSYVGISTAMSVYRNKNGILDYITAGVATGVLYKFNLGPRGWLVGGGLGLALGLVAGGTTLGLLKVTGMTMNDVRYWNYEWKEKRGRIVTEKFKKYMNDEESEEYQEHRKKVGDDLNMDGLQTENKK